MGEKQEHRNKDVNIVQGSRRDEWWVILGQRMPGGYPDKNAVKLVEGVSRDVAITIADALQAASDQGEEDVCFYRPGQKDVHDMLVFKEECGLVGRFSNQSLPELLGKHPEGQVLPVKQAAQIVKRLILEAHEKPPVMIRKAQYEQALYALPPQSMAGSRDSESFVFGEPLTEGISSYYVRVADDYFRINARDSLTHDKLVSMANEVLPFVVKASVNVTPKTVADLPQVLLDQWAQELPEKVHEAASITPCETGLYKLFVEAHSDESSDSLWNIQIPEGISEGQAGRVVDWASTILSETIWHKHALTREKATEMMQSVSWVPKFELDEEVDTSMPYLLDEYGEVITLSSHAGRGPEGASVTLTTAHDIVAVMYFSREHDDSWGDEERQALFCALDENPTMVAEAKHSCMDDAWSKFEQTIDMLRSQALKLS